MRIKHEDAVAAVRDGNALPDKPQTADNHHVEDQRHRHGDHEPLQHRSIESNLGRRQDDQRQHGLKSRVDKPFFIDSVMMPRLENKKPNASRIRI